ncbi:hypothetical protein F4820DRAFT_468117 [Hypoxylon rubiginosum]|uniref:Uncharacterized protein n=1 Tax=Hypoxylon rubiginosum TaxID=110542 RepID=A0ACB9YI31_9PEZI|nr:hypothetical protein F4820DRAFT_468117 [Hypoxylon rubiginosum]
MKLVRVKYEEVLEDINSRSRQPTNDCKFNTSFHPESDEPNTPVPTELPYSFRRWLPLVMRSRGLLPADSQVITFSLSQARLLLKVANSSIPCGYVNRIYREEIKDEILPTLQRLQFPPEGLFMRLEACSAKDGVQSVPGRLSLSSVDDVILRLVTSSRARNALAKILSPDRSDASIGFKPDLEEFKLFFLPFNNRMQLAREYRVFCPPVDSLADMHISAISQYEWHKLWLFAFRSEDHACRIAKEITRKCEEILTEIRKDLMSPNEMDRYLLTQGFTFDVLFDEQTRQCQLIEVNVFGIRSACGSCLFQWKTDKDVLYSAGGKTETEFRITY